MEVYSNDSWYIHLKPVNEFDWGSEENKIKLVKDGYEYLPIIKNSGHIDTCLEQSPIVGVTVKQEHGNTFSSFFNNTPSHMITFFVYNIYNNRLQTVHVHDWEIEYNVFDNKIDNDTWMNYEYILSLLWSQNNIDTLIDLEKVDHHPFNWLNIANSNLEDSYLINSEVIKAFNDNTYINLIYRGKYDRVMKERDKLKFERDELVERVKELEQELQDIKDDRVTAENCRHFE